MQKVENLPPADLQVKISTKAQNQMPFTNPYEFPPIFLIFLLALVRAEERKKVFRIA